MALSKAIFKCVKCNIEKEIDITYLGDYIVSLPEGWYGRDDMVLCQNCYAILKDEIKTDVNNYD